MASSLKRMLQLISAPHSRTISTLYTRAVVTRSSCSTLRCISTTAAAPRSDVNAFRSREEQRYREQSAAQSAEQSEAGDSADAAAGDAEAKRARVDAVRDQILDASLAYVPTLGWTREALEAGARSVQLPSIVHGLFPAGGFELVEYFARQCDRQLVEHLRADAQQQLLTAGGAGSNGVSVELGFVAAAIQYRLELLEPMLTVWSQALGLRVLPANGPVALAQLQRMVDDICYHAGDRSTDFNWYTRRIAVASLYKLTELHLLQDTSPAHCDTWAFLRRRVAELDGAQSALAGSGNAVQSAFAAASSVMETIRNMSGIPLGRV